MMRLGQVRIGVPGSALAVKLRQWFFGLLAILAAGCLGIPQARVASDIPGPVAGAMAGAGPVADDRAGTVPGRAEAGPGRAAVGPGSGATEELGILRLTIAWPPREPGYRISAIPTNTSTLRIQILDADSNLADERLVMRGEEATQSVDLYAKAGVNLTVWIYAYAKRATSVGDLAGEEAIARGSGVVTLGRSQVSRLSLTLSPLFAPFITGFDSAAGRVGDPILIKGLNLGGSTPTVTFGGATASTFLSQSSTSIGVVVPQGARVGNVAVTLDGIRSDSVAIFWVIDTLTATASKETWDPSASGKLMVLGGQILTFKAEPKWVLPEGEVPGVPPAIVWASSNTDAGTIGTTSGIYAAKAQAGTSVVTARAGAVTSNAILVTSVVVTNVDLAPSSLVLYMPPPAGYTAAGLPATGSLAAQVVYSSDVQVRGVTWSSGAPLVASVDSAGVVTAQAPGSAIITARSLDDQTKVATASVVVKDEGLVDIGLE